MTTAAEALVRDCANRLDQLFRQDYTMREVEAELRRLLRAALAQPQEGDVEECECPVEGHLLGCPRDNHPLAKAYRATRNGHSPPSTAGNTVGQAGLTVGPNLDGESPAQPALAQEPTITVSGPVACGKSYVMELIYKALRNAGLHPYSDELAHERRMVEEQPQPAAKVWRLRESVYAAPPQATPAQEPVACDREFLGRIVRMEWIDWAREQPNPKPSWLVPWEELSEPDREVDRRIGERLWTMFRDALYATPQPDEAVALLRALEPHLDKLICYASTTDEYEPNAIVARIRAFLKDRT